MKTILLLLASAALGLASDLLPYEYHCQEKGHPIKLVLYQSPHEPEVVLVTRYTLVDGQNPYYKVKKTERWEKSSALAFVAQARKADAVAAEQQTALAADYLRQRREAAAKAEQDKRDKDMAARIQQAVESALEKDRALRD